MKVHCIQVETSVSVVGDRALIWLLLRNERTNGQSVRVNSILVSEGALGQMSWEGGGDVEGLPQRFPFALKGSEHTEMPPQTIILPIVIHFTGHVSSYLCPNYVFSPRWPSGMPSQGHAHAHTFEHMGPRIGTVLPEASLFYSRRRPQLDRKYYSGLAGPCETAAKIA